MKTILINGFKHLSGDIKIHTLYIIETYMKAGYECYMVGGPVRDILIGISPKDIDFATNCPIEKTKELFKNVIPTGEQHGTVTIHEDGENYEVTRYRTDIETDGRHAVIKFADTIEEDLSRRDFRINAIAFNPITQELIDSENGIDDIKKGIIQFVGNPIDRIKEDKLRVLRLLRFYARFKHLAFKIPVNDLQSAIKYYNPTVVSVERIYQELDGIFKALQDHYDDELKEFLIRNLQALNLFKRFKSDKLMIDMIIEDMFKTYDYLPLVLAMKGDIQTLKLSSTYRELHTLFITFQNGFEGKDFSDQSTVKTILRLTDGNFDMCEQLLNSFKLLNKENNHKDGLITLKTLKNKVGTVDEEPYKVTQLKVNGGDMIKMGFKGPEIGMYLNVLLKQVVDNPQLNTKEKLLGLLK